MIINIGVRAKSSHQRIIEAVNLAFPNAIVTKYEGLIDKLDLPDENDRHLLAAAIKINANVIITDNLKHFPSEYVNSFGIEVQQADEFCVNAMDLVPERALEAFLGMVAKRIKTPVTRLEMLDQLRNNRLYESAEYIHRML